MRWLHRLPHNFHQIFAQGIEVRLISKLRGESFQRLPSVVLSAIEAAIDTYIEAACAQAQDAAWEAAWEQGRSMSLEEATEFTLSHEEPVPAKTAGSEEPLSILSRREQEVSILVSRGFTNRQIASELSISEHTVATHVGRTVRKLGLRSRSRLAAWTTEQQVPPSLDSV